MSQAFDNYRNTYGDAVQGSIDFTGLPHDFFMRAKVDVLRDVLAARNMDPAQMSLLDVGCGVGTLHPLLQNMFGKISGVDVSAECIAEARARFGANDYRAYDGLRLPFADGSFDFILTVCVVHHVPPAQWPDFFAEMRRITRAGGLVCVIEHNPLNPLTRLGVARCAFDHDAVLLRSRRTEALMGAAGARGIESRYFLLAPFEAAPIRAAERALRHLPLGGQYVTTGVV
jgi:SAM-dependent methyltransferase